MLQGTLDEFELSEILRFLARGHKTGHLSITGSKGYGHIQVHDGRLCAVQSSLAREPVGRKLLRRRAVQESDLRRAIDLADRGPLRLGETLVNQGAVARNAVDEALKEQIEDELINILQIDPTEFSWDASPIKNHVIELDIDPILGKVSALASELQSMRDLLPREEIRISLSPTPPSEQDPVRLDRDQWTLLALLTGRRDLKDLVRYSGLGEIKTLRALHEMLGAGLVEIGAASGSGTRTDP